MVRVDPVATRNRLTLKLRSVKCSFGFTDVAPSGNSVLHTLQGTMTLIADFETYHNLRALCFAIVPHFDAHFPMVLLGRKVATHKQQGCHCESQSHGFILDDV